MGRGRKPSRGGSRRFTDVETLKQQSRELNRGQAGEDEEEDDVAEEEQGDKPVINRQGAVGELPPSESESEESDEDNPSKPNVSGDKKTSSGASAAAAANSLQPKNKKIKDLTLEDLDITDEKRGLNRKEREEVAKAEAKKKYQALNAAGKTDEARADLARLAIIRAEREEAAKKRELEQKVKEAAAKARADARKKGQSKKI